MHDDEVRDLMHQAASTIHVDPLPVGHVLSAPSTSSSGPTGRAARRWVVPAGAAATVLLILIVSIALGSRWGSESDGQSAAVSSSGSTEESESTPPGDSDDTANAFVAFAAGEESVVPWADEVTYFVGGRTAVATDAAGATRRDTWEGCPQGATYAGRACPVSALAPVAELVGAGAEPSYEPASPATVGCSKGAAPRALEAEKIVTIRPPMAMRDCFSDFAVSLYLDENGRVLAVNLQLSSP